MAEPDWKTKVIDLTNQYNAIKAVHPNLSTTEIAIILNKSITILRKSLIVFNHLSNPKVNSAKSFNSAYDAAILGNKSWQSYISNLHLEYEKAVSTNPTLSFNEIAALLSKSPRTIYRMLVVHKYLNDPKINKLKTLNDAYRRIKNTNENKTASVKNQIKTNMDSIISVAEEA